MIASGGCRSSPNIRTWSAARGRISPRPGTPRTLTPIWCTPAFATYCPDNEYERMTAMQTSRIVNGKRNGVVPVEKSPEVSVVIDGSNRVAHAGERLVDVINRAGVKLSQICYHSQLGPLQTCDTCLVEINGQLVRACATTVSEGMSVSTISPKAHAARQGGFARLLSNP